MRKLFFGMVAMAALLMGSCSADDMPANNGNVQLDGGPSGGNGGITPPPPPPPGGGG
jgi:hypothetical protein